MQRTLGTCYYPEHWPEEIWQEDAARMVEVGLTWVRIGEFAWSRIEPTSGDLRWDWLDRAIDTLVSAGLKVILGTPTATPPRWILDRHPDMLALDAEGRPRGFGSRRHYCFSHEGYRAECRRIVTLIAERYGPGDRIAAWQTDNEYGCHDTTISYSPAAQLAFCKWLEQRYDGDISALNIAWGNVFWSMDYNRFDQIALPNLTVTEPNPAHVQAFRRFSSDQVVAFNRDQARILRTHSRAPIAHNYMGRVTDFDHYKTGDDLDIASWDSYPLGFLEDRVGASAEDQRRYARQGDPDFQAFHHDLYRAVGRGRWWVMEQQPGPVNWAPYNPAPLPGMVRFWTWEAFAHGAEAVCYFRWRQAPFAQEQMHAGMLRPDSVPAQAFAEAQQVSEELATTPDVQHTQAPVALIFDYDAEWAWQTQPHGAGLSYFNLVLDHYRALRRAGLSVDIAAPTRRDFAGYNLILAPGLMHLAQPLRDALTQTSAIILYGPRTGVRNEEFSIPVPLPPGLTGLDLRVIATESLRPDMSVPLAPPTQGNIKGYVETLEGSAKALLRDTSGKKVAVTSGRQIYCGGWLDATGLDHLIALLCAQAGLATRSLPEGVRIRQTETEEFWFNHNATPIKTEVGTLPAACVLRRRLTR
ncbi:beta-galactosidase [Phaeobacter porticola]|uniref:Beta-galactosidase n=1 Tax=Phaeobacter porticola TaxID=1844006 RepID=A0A1L3I6S3_9RHOB|nr:beta-galactosidase [Phaeobacter porticola]APG47844.1 beta-galactosidase 1 [Phaeobacter porticola]